MLHEGWRYFKSYQNIADALYAATLIISILTDLSYQAGYFETMSIGADMELCKIFYAFLILLSYFKLLTLLRIFDRISFIIKMLKQVSKELIPFLFLFLSFVVVFSLMVMTLGFDLNELENDPYKGLWDFGYLMYVLRTSLADFEVDTFQQLRPASTIILWIFWIIIILFNTIIFLNFLIAVISDVYEQVMESRTEEIFQKKA